MSLEYILSRFEENHLSPEKRFKLEPEGKSLFHPDMFKKFERIEPKNPREKRSFLLRKVQRDLPATEQGIRLHEDIKDFFTREEFFYKMTETAPAYAESQKEMMRTHYQKILDSIEQIEHYKDELVSQFLI